MLRDHADDLLAHDGVRVLVVDDGSPDGTADVAEAFAAAHRSRVQVLRRTGPRGLGRSYIDGMLFALRTDATHVCQMDADLSHDPRHLPDLIAATVAADLAIGCRTVSWLRAGVDLLGRTVEIALRSGPRAGSTVRWPVYEARGPREDLRIGRIPAEEVACAPCISAGRA